uniref:Methyltransferase domain-containing protein n=1 Tax=viral metagenome TaxID=1070528 RepID=A0A6C0KZX7_9ZZZZ|tara:strand:- start:1598 stop:2296 length:699 start_codon:yes stop_codon:yes gene_type:complete
MKVNLLYCSIYFNTINSLSYTPYKYPYDPRIHNFGNVGLGGKFHASLARPITKVIDNAAYEGEDIREIIATTLKNLKIETISDWACGTGMSTDALFKTFKNATISAFDTSEEMLEVARKSSICNAKFLLGDIENVRLPKRADLITIMFAFHEIPQNGRLKILKNAKENLADGGHLLVVDIDISYTPSKMMLTGEPYVLDYLSNIRSDIFSIFPCVKEDVPVPGHVRQWLLKK